MNSRLLKDLLIDEYIFIKMKKNIFLAGLFCFALDANAQISTSAELAPVSPIEYKQDEGVFKILTYIKTKNITDSHISGSVDGKPTEIIKTSRQDSLLVWLPMIGNDGVLKINAGKKTLLEQTYKTFIPSDWGYFKNGTIHIIQSSHQDIAWMDTPDFCRRDRINNIILPALDIMKKNPDFKFEMEQTLNLMEFLDEHPDRKDELIKLYKEGRFGWGATFNQPYEGLSSGEQLVRQAYYGRKWIRENLPGCDDVVANNIDVPGRSWQMPQILAKCGIPNLFISRMGEGLYDWYSPDGSKVLTFTPGNYGWASLIWKFFDKDGITALHKLHHRTQLWSDYFRKHQIPPHYAILMSCDATKPVDFQKVINEWNKIAEASDNQLPKLKASTAEDYFKAVRGENTQFEKIAGDRPNLWLYIHGPAHYEANAYKREAAVLLPAAESFTSFASLLDNDFSDYPRSQFDRAWMASIYPDHGLGGKNGEITDGIYEDSLKLSRDMGENLLTDALKEIVDQVNTKVNNYVIFNDLTWNRTDLASVKISREYAIVKDENGKEIPSQVVTDKDGNRKIVFRAENIPSMGYRSYTILEGKKSKVQKNSDVVLTSNSVENTFFKAVLGNGGIVSLYDRQLNKELIHTSKFACGDIVELGYKGNGAGEFTRITDVTPGDIKTLSQRPSVWKMTENGPLLTRFEQEQPTEHTTINQVITFYHLDKKIDFHVVLKDFDGEHNRQYRIAFPLNIMEDRTINYEVPMAVAEVGRDELKRKPGGWAWNGSYLHNPEDSHPREIQNFISAQGNGFGLTMASRGVAVADWIDPSREVAGYPILQGILLSSHKSCHGEGNWYHQTGTHAYQFSITSHREGWKNGYHFGESNNHPLLVQQKMVKGGTLNENHSFLQISDPFTMLSLVKKADKDNSLIIRLTEMEGKDKEILVTLPIEVKQVIHTNLIEDEKEKLNVSGKQIRLRLGHHAIETFKLVL